jgi:hypothetical protein
MTLHHQTPSDSLFGPIDLEATLGQISDDDEDQEEQGRQKSGEEAPVARTSSKHPGIVTPNAERRVLDDENRELLLQTIAFRKNLVATVPEDWKNDDSCSQGDDGLVVMHEEEEDALSLAPTCEGDDDDCSMMTEDDAGFSLEEISADPASFWNEGVHSVGGAVSATGGAQWNMVPESVNFG